MCRLSIRTSPVYPTRRVRRSGLIEHIVSEPFGFEDVMVRCGSFLSAHGCTGLEHTSTATITLSSGCNGNMSPEGFFKKDQT